MDILKLLDELDNLAKSSIHIVMTPWTVINENEFERIVHAIRKEFPSALNEAILINKQKEEIIQNAKQQAAEILEEARTYAQNIASDNEIAKLSEEQAEFIVNKAKEEANRLVTEAINYIEQVFSKLEADVGNIHKSVFEAHRGISSISPEQLLKMPPDDK